jgi:hypothetical protein
MRKLQEKELGNKLRDELDAVVFNDAMKAAVMKQAARKPSFWTKELVIPVPAIVAAAVLMCAIPFACWHQAKSLQSPALQTSASDSRAEQTQRLIVSSAGVFYESQLGDRGPGRHDTD